MSAREGREGRAELEGGLAFGRRIARGGMVLTVASRKQLPDETIDVEIAHRSQLLRLEVSPATPSQKDGSA